MGKVVELKGRRMDGSVFPLELALSEAHDGGERAFTAIIRDITARRRAEKALKDSQALCESLVENLPTAVYRKDVQGRFTFANTRFYELVGKAADERLGCTDFDLTPEDQARKYRADDLRVMETGRLLDCIEEHTRSVDGKRRWLQTFKSPVRDATGRIVGTQGVLLDITEHRAAEQALERLATAVDQAAEAVMFTDTAGTIQYVNPAFERTTGYTRAEAIGQNQRFLKSGKQDAEFYRQLWAPLTRGEVWSGHFTNKRKDGSFYEEESTISPVLDAAGQIVNYVAVKHDLTEQKTLEAQLLRTQRLESVGRLASGIAHDLNNILAPILMGAPLLRENIIGQDTLRLLDTIEANAQRGADIIKQFLTFGRGMAGERTLVQLRALVQDMVSIIRETFPKNITARRELPAQPWLVNGDTTQLHQVMANWCWQWTTKKPCGGSPKEYWTGTATRVVEAANGAEGLTRDVQKREQVQAVVTDLMMPFMDGPAFIRALRELNSEAEIIAVSGLQTDSGLPGEPEAQVQAFVAKPFTAAALLHTLQEVLHPVPEGVPAAANRA